MDPTLKADTRPENLLKLLEVDEDTKTRECSGNNSNVQPYFFAVIPSSSSSSQNISLQDEYSCCCC